MATRRHGQIVETPTEARQGEPGPSVLALLTVSTSLAVLILGVSGSVFPHLRHGRRALGAFNSACYASGPRRHEQKVTLRLCSLFIAGSRR